MKDFAQETGEGQNCVMLSVTEGRSSSWTMWIYMEGLSSVTMESADDVMNGE